MLLEVFLPICNSNLGFTIEFIACFMIWAVNIPLLLASMKPIAVYFVAH